MISMPLFLYGAKYETFPSRSQMRNTGGSQDSPSDAEPSLVTGYHWLFELIIFGFPWQSCTRQESFYVTFPA